MALSPRVWRPRTEPFSSEDPSTTAWQEPTSVRPPTPLALAQARWRSISQVGVFGRPSCSPSSGSSTAASTPFIAPSGKFVSLYPLASLQFRPWFFLHTFLFVLWGGGIIGCSQNDLRGPGVLFPAMAEHLYEGVLLAWWNRSASGLTSSKFCSWS